MHANQVGVSAQGRAGPLPAGTLHGSYGNEVPLFIVQMMLAQGCDGSTREVQ